MERRLVRRRVTASTPRFAPLFLALAILPLLAPTPPWASAADLAPGRHVLHGERVRVCNAIGSVSMVPTEGADVIVEVTTRGADAGRLRVVIDDCDGAKRLKVIYPGNRIVDPEMRASKWSRTMLDGCCGGEWYRFTSRGEGLDARADMVIRVPKAQKLGLGLAAGDIRAGKVNGAIGIDTGGAPIMV